MAPEETDSFSGGWSLAWREIAVAFEGVECMMGEVGDGLVWVGRREEVGREVVRGGKVSCP